MISLSYGTSIGLANLGDLASNFGGYLLKSNGVPFWLLSHTLCEAKDKKTVTTKIIKLNSHRLTDGLHIHDRQDDNLSVPNHTLFL